MLGDSPNPEGEEETIELLQVPVEANQVENKQEEDVHMDEPVEPRKAGNGAWGIVLKQAANI